MRISGGAFHGPSAYADPEDRRIAERFIALKKHLGRPAGRGQPDPFGRARLPAASKRGAAAPGRAVRSHGVPRRATSLAEALQARASAHEDVATRGDAMVAAARARIARLRADVNAPGGAGRPSPSLRAAAEKSIRDLEKSSAKLEANVKLLRTEARQLTSAASNLRAAASSAPRASA